MFSYTNWATESREKASSQIMSGIVYVNGIKVDKPGQGLP